MVCMLLFDFLQVPSLYVRVYRAAPLQSKTQQSSLTIREGVSWDELKEIKARKFPHYT